MGYQWRLAIGRWSSFVPIMHRQADLEPEAVEEELI